MAFLHVISDSEVTWDMLQGALISGGGQSVYERFEKESARVVLCDLFRPDN